MAVSKSGKSGMTNLDGNPIDPNVVKEMYEKIRKETS
jgi:hypothetical protein